jgi:NDP-sugar pyrophosphorylase family protein
MAGLTLVIMAAGVGSRYGGLKQLEAVGPGGETLIEYSIFDALRSGFGRIVLIIRRETEADFRGFLDPRIDGKVPVDYVFQTLENTPDGFEPTADRSKPWGTGHAVLVAEQAVTGPFAVINADDFYGGESFTVLSRFLRGSTTRDELEFALPGFKVGPTLSDSGPVSRGLCRVDGEGRLRRIVEVLELWKRGDHGWFTDAEGVEHVVNGEEPVSMNMWGFTPAVFSALREGFRRFLDREGWNPGSEFLLPEVVQAMIDEGRVRVRVLDHDGRWCGITFPEDRERAKKFIAGLVERGVYPARLWSGEAVGHRFNICRASSIADCSADENGRNRNE